MVHRKPNIAVPYSYTKYCNQVSWTLGPKISTQFQGLGIYCRAFVRYCASLPDVCMLYCPLYLTEEILREEFYLSRNTDLYGPLSFLLILHMLQSIEILMYCISKYMNVQRYFSCIAEFPRSPPCIFLEILTSSVQV